MKVYIAGPMSGIEDFNFPAFFAAEKRWYEDGWEVVNPAAIDVAVDGSDPAGRDVVLQPETVYMRRDLPEVAQCDAIALLPGWRQSSGAMKEYQVAVWCGLSLWDAETMQPLPPESILDEAQRLVHGARGADYGHPVDDFGRTGRIWGAILGIDDVPPEKVALCMVGVKLSREVNAPKRDNRVDGAGYFETADMVHVERESRARMRNDHVVE